MSDLLESPAPESPKEAKARAKAEKAYAKASRPWYKKPLLAGPAALVALMVISGIASSGGGETEQPATSNAAAPADNSAAAPANDVEVAEPEAEAPAAENLPGLGDRVQDGKFTFVVHSFDCGEKSVGSQYMEEKAQGQFCLMDISVENHGDAPQMLSGSDQLVFDSKGREFANDDMAAMSIEGNDALWLEEINPGNKVRGTLVFDVPEKAKIVSAELHDSMFSSGVKLSLK